MKKILLILISFVLILAGCNKDETDKVCKELSNDVLFLSLEYNADPSEENCFAYKTAIEDYINDCDNLSQEAIAEFNALISGLTCTELSCYQLQLDVNQTGSEYALNPTNDNCLAYKAALQDYLAGCDSLTEEAIESYNAILSNLDC